MTKSNKHRAEVIEIYENGLKAAVKFYCNYKRGERIECVNHNGTEGNPNKTQVPFHIGQKGWVKYSMTLTLNGSMWSFEPYENR